AWVATAFAVGSAICAAAAGPLVAAGIRYGLSLAPMAALICVAVLTVVYRASSAPARVGGA
ncbi:MFS transporter, partial [Actinoplanes sp. NPDC048791]